MISLRFAEVGGEFPELVRQLKTLQICTTGNSGRPVSVRRVKHDGSTAGFTVDLVSRLAEASTITTVPISSDTTPEAERYYTKFLRSLTGEEKVRLAVEMTETANKICKQGIAHRHPTYTEDEIHFAFLRIIWGHELFAQVHPSGPFLTP